MKPTLCVMAAGMGSRYGGIKQIEPVGDNGEAIIDYSVFDAFKAGFGRVVFIIRKDIEADFKAFVAERFPSGVKIDFVYQELDALPAGFSPPKDRKKPWGTGQAILVARETIKEPFAVINADDFYGRAAFVAMHAYLADQAADGTDFGMMAYVLRNTLSEHGSVSRGICQVDSEGWLLEVEEHTKIERTASGIISRAEAVIVPAGRARPEKDLLLTGDEPVSMNFFGFTPTIFPHLDRLFRAFLAADGERSLAEFLIPAAAGRLVREGVARMRVLTSDARWFGITYREDRPAVAANIRALVADGVYPRRLTR